MILKKCLKENEIEKSNQSPTRTYAIYERTEKKKDSNMIYGIGIIAIIAGMILILKKKKKS